MNDKFSTTSQLDWSRRDILGATTVSAAAALVAPMAGLFSAGAQAAGAASVSAYGVTTAQLKDWSIMTKSIGVGMDFAGTNNSVGVFLRDIVASRLGEKTDFFIFESGTQNILGPRGLYLPLDEKKPELKLWARTPNEWKHSAVVQDGAGKQWGVPVIGNADSFGYFPGKLGLAPNNDKEISWSVMFDDERTRGRVAYDQTWTYSLGVAALYLESKGGAKFSNPADLTKAESKRVVDFLIERKKAGQFRTLHSAFEEQVQLLVTREVDVINCWEPAVREANLKLGKDTTRYAYTVEGYFKWGHGAYIAAEAGKRGNLDAIYKVLNYFLDGEYRALQARDRGYAGPNMDLGVAYAVQNGWSAEDVAGLKATEAKVARKFAKPYVSTTTPTNADAMEQEWQRFLNA